MSLLATNPPTLLLPSFSPLLWFYVAQNFTQSEQLAGEHSGTHYFLQQSVETGRAKKGVITGSTVIR